MRWCVRYKIRDAVVSNHRNHVISDLFGDFWADCRNYGTRGRGVRRREGASTSLAPLPQQRVQGGMTVSPGSRFGIKLRGGQGVLA